MNDDDRLALRAVLEKWDVPIHIHDAMDVDLFQAVEDITAARETEAYANGWQAAYDDLHESSRQDERPGGDA